MIRFENADYLVLILPVLPALTLSFIRIKKIENAYADFMETQKIIRRAKFKTIFFSAAWFFAVTAAACPMWGTKKIFVKRQNAAIMFVADVSASMTVNDVKPSRLAAAKYFAHFIIQKSKDTAIGLVIAKGEAVLATPISFEHTALSSAINVLSENSNSSAGTNLENGILKALNSFGEDRGNEKIIILLTDGGETKGSLIKAVKEISRSEAVLVIVGIGTAEGSMLEVLDEKGGTIMKKSCLEETFLKKAVNEGGGRCFYVNTSSSGSIWKVIDLIQNKKNGDKKVASIQNPVKRNFEMTLAALICFCIGFAGLYERRKIINADE